MRVGIVGCSVNGAYLAGKLAKDGHTVTIFERKKKIGGKACSGMVSERIWDFIPKKNDLVYNKINSVEIRFPRKKISVEFRPKMLVMKRNKLDKYVAKLAKKSGARIKLGHTVTKTIYMKGTKPNIVAERGRKTIVQEFDRVIGCDGANSQIQKQLNLRKPPLRLGIYMNIRKKMKGGSVEVTPTKSGFKWKIPRGRVVEIGIIEKPNDAKKTFKRMVRGKKKKIFSAMIPEGLVVSSDKRFAFCGDAAGLTKPWSGGGIIWGMVAADMLSKSNLDVPRYNRMLETHFAPKIAFSRIMRRLVLLAGNNAPWLMPKKTVMDSDWLY